MDEAFIKQNPLTKGDFITEFFNLEKRHEEMWAAFLSKIENMMIEGWDTFSYNFTEDDQFAVIQQNVCKDAQSSECGGSKLSMFGDSWATFRNSESIFCLWDEFSAKHSIVSSGKWIFRNIGNFAKGNFQNS
jgi:hypothetical protein